MRKFNGETELADNEYLLKVDKRPVYYGDSDKEFEVVGFLAKLNKGNKLPPKPFIDWGGRKNLEVNIVEQNLRKGWRVADYRRGTSADWIVVEHPDGYELEIKTWDFIELLNKVTVTKGLIKEALRWEEGELKLK